MREPWWSTMYFRTRLRIREFGGPAGDDLSSRVEPELCTQPEVALCKLLVVSLPVSQPRTKPLPTSFVAVSAWHANPCNFPCPSLFAWKSTRYHILRARVIINSSTKNVTEECPLRRPFTGISTSATGS